MKYFWLNVETSFYCEYIAFRLKQVEDYRSRLEGDLHEINKPLARYSDDKDLEEMLKKQERDGDPMLNYIRNKKESGADGTPCKCSLSFWVYFKQQ